MQSCTSGNALPPIALSIIVKHPIDNPSVQIGHELEPFRGRNEVSWRNYSTFAVNHAEEDLITWYLFPAGCDNLPTKKRKAVLRDSIPYIGRGLEF